MTQQDKKPSDLYGDLVAQILGLIFHGGITVGAGALALNGIAAEPRQWSEIGLFIALATFMACRTNDSYKNVRNVIAQIQAAKQQNIKLK